MAALTTDGTALLVLDLQVALADLELAPRPMKEVVKVAADLISVCRREGIQVFFVRTCTEPDGRDWPPSDTDAGQLVTMPRAATTLLAGLSVEPGDILISKRQWSAFYGTDLDLQLRRRGIRSLILLGVATNFVVEGTAREGWQLGFEQFFVEDGMASFNADWHQFSITQILPRLGRVIDAAAAAKLIGQSRTSS